MGCYLHVLEGWKDKGDSSAAQRITRKEPCPRAGEQQKGLGPQDFIAQESPGELRGRPLGRRPCSLLLVFGSGCNRPVWEYKGNKPKVETAPNGAGVKAIARLLRRETSSKWEGTSPVSPSRLPGFF